MSKLEKLIQQYCPDGVEYVKLDSVANVCRGTRVVKSQLSDKGYPVYQNCLTPMGYFERSNCNAGITFVICGGAAGNVGYTDVECWAADDCEFIIGNHQVINRYIYYYLMTKQNYLLSKVRKASIPRLSPSIIKDLEIPVPPLPVQEEIVRILDTFTELQAELQKRQQQYNFYRDNLLNFNRGGQEIKWMKMSEICIKISSGGTPSRGNSDYFNGDIPWLRTQEVNWNDIYDTEIKITKEAINKSAAKLIPKNCVIIAMYGATAGKTCINKIPLTTNQACCNLQIDANAASYKAASYKYVYYCVCNDYEKIKSLGQGSQHNINAQIIKDYIIPVPSLAEQNRIVAILDRFDTLTNDLTSGLPAEMEKRRQQYEYYRDRLLTFKRL